MLLSKGPALVPGYAFDDYGVIAQPRSFDFTISQGRFTQALLQLAINQIGVSATHVAWTSALVFFVAAAAAIALGLHYVTRRNDSKPVVATAAALLATYPI